MTYDALLVEADQHNIYVIENMDFESSAKALIHDDVIGINRTVRSNLERACVLAEELGHYYSNTGDITDLSSVSNRKQECKGRLTGFDKMVGLIGIVSAYKAGCRNLYEMADHLDVTEEYLKEALDAYRSKYGVYTKVDNYVIYFEPNLCVLELTQETYL